jgi:hypothetical protein
LGFRGHSQGGGDQCGGFLLGSTASKRSRIQGLNCCIQAGGAFCQRRFSGLGVNGGVNQHCAQTVDFGFCNFAFGLQPFPFLRGGLGFSLPRRGLAGR